jgi:hypothetical protein
LLPEGALQQALKGVKTINQIAQDEDLAILRDLDALHTRWPFYGQRKLRLELLARGWDLGRKRLRRLMRQGGICEVTGIWSSWRPGSPSGCAITTTSASTRNSTISDLGISNGRPKPETGLAEAA